MENRDELLKEILAETLESFAFIFSEPADPTPPASIPYLWATIAFHSAQDKGCLTMAVPDPVCREMAANILGAEPAETDEQTAKDALKELSNVVLGSFTARHYGANVVCDLDAPEAEEAPRQALSELAKTPNTITLIVDDYPIWARIQTGGPDGSAN